MKYAIFLGAGASASCGAPVQNNLFKEYFKNRSNISRRHCFDADKMATFFCSQFGINVEEGNLDNVDFPTFEEVLGILDLALAKDESFRECGLASEDHNPSNSISQLRQMVVDLMAYTIYHQVNFVENKHKELIRSLDSNKLLDDCFFISTNYDILIDNAITDKGHSIDYGCHMVNHAFCVENEFNSNVKTIPLYKIHGSLNWLYCPTCNEMTLTCGKGAIDGEKKSCDTCKGLMQKIIIPPTYFKNFNNYFLNSVWHNAEQKLKTVEKIIFLGYSFPDADIYIKYLLKRIESNRDTPPEIVVCNYVKNKNKLYADNEQLRYNRFFKGKVSYKKGSGFDDFCKTPKSYI